MAVDEVDLAPWRTVPPLKLLGPRGTPLHFHWRITRPLPSVLEDDEKVKAFGVDN